MHRNNIGQDARRGAADCGAVNSGEYLTLGQAGQRLPGRPSACTVWRWGRKGVKARSGDRIKLQHVRLGGRVYTRLDWLDEFGKRLAEADVAHFDARAETPLPPRNPAFGSPSWRGGRCHRSRVVESSSEIAEIERELDKEGL